MIHKSKIKEKELRRLAELINQGKAGVDKEGKIVSLKNNPKAVKINEHHKE